MMGFGREGRREVSGERWKCRSPIWKVLGGIVLLFLHASSYELIYFILFFYNCLKVGGSMNKT